MKYYIPFYLNQRDLTLPGIMSIAGMASLLRVSLCIVNEIILVLFLTLQVQEKSMNANPSSGRMVKSPKE